jgi:hypothetical protein
MRKVKTFERTSNRWDEPTPKVERPHRLAVVYYHADWQEYFVRCWEDGKSLGIRTAEDMASAMATADYFVNRE